MRVPSYYSINPSDPDVFHTFDDCRSGKQIPLANRKQGTNGWRLCGHCRDM